MAIPKLLKEFFMKKAILFLLFLPSLVFSEVAVTAYNDNLGVVRETRPFELKEGLQTLRFQDVASQITPPR